MLACCLCSFTNDIMPQVTETQGENTFPLLSANESATICIDTKDAKVVEITASMLSDDVERVTGKTLEIMKVNKLTECKSPNIIIAGTIGQNAIIDQLISSKKIDVKEINGKWEAYIITTVQLSAIQQALIIVGSDRRGTAYGLTTLSRAIGVSPWYWWADVQPTHRNALYIQKGRFVQHSPSVQYRGIFINDERFGGWARWVENTFDKDTHQVGPKVYEKVFELLLRLRANYLWPAMHPGTQAFNANPENARLADDYAIVMGSSHCEQMLRNNEGEWKAVGTYGDFNYITNKKTMQDYWETRVKTNGQYENTYTLGLRGIHDYPMEGANTNEQRVALMQQAIDDQRDMLRRNINRPIEQIPQVLCTYEEVLDAYHSGLKVPDDVTLLWSDDKQGYTRNLCNPEEMKRSGGAGIYYHLSYHGDPESWIWLSPLSPAFISTELTKAYTFGARKIWVFNVGDIKPAEKEISFALEMAWNVERWSPQSACNFIRTWAAETFGEEYADEIASMQEVYYRLMASGKDSHIWFVEYPESEIMQRIHDFRNITQRAEALAKRIPDHLQAAYFELVLYPIKGVQIINEYQLQSRLSLRHATEGKMATAMTEGAMVTPLYETLNQWTKQYNDELLDGKWRNFFNWRPYRWYYSDSLDVTFCNSHTAKILEKSPAPQLLDVEKVLSAKGMKIKSKYEGDIKLWVKALTPVRNFSKSKEDNEFGRVVCNKNEFMAAAIPINNVWHSPLVGPRWCEVGTLHLKKGNNLLQIKDVVQEAKIDEIFIGLYPPLPAEPIKRIAAADYTSSHNTDGKLQTVSQLGYTNGVTVLPFDTPSHEIDTAPYVEYNIDIPSSASQLEVRTLPTLHIYEGRDARFAVSIDNEPVKVFSIHEGDFTSEWRLNVLRGYATRSMSLEGTLSGTHTVRIYLLDPGITLQEILVK